MAKSAIERFLENVAKFGDDLSRRQRDAILRQYSPELTNTLRRVSEIKNLIYRSRPAKLENIFVEPDIIYGEDVTVSASDLFDAFENGTRFVLRGSAGLGKSVLLKHFCLRHVHKNLSFAPLFLELRKIKPEHSNDLVKALHDNYKGIKNGQSEPSLIEALQNRNFSVLLDGFDEVAPDIRNSVEGAILSFSAQYPACPLIVSGRSERTFDSWEQFHVVDIAPMNQERTISLISKLDYNSDIKHKFITEAVPRLFDNRDVSFVQTPLLAVLMLLTYQNYADIPEQMHIFYANAFETLLRDHDVTKSQFRRPLACGLPEEDFKKLFSAFCALTYSKKRFEFSFSEIEEFLLTSLISTSLTSRVRDVIKDLTLSVCVMQYENLEYSFVHRSFQEYFTAVYLKNSPFETVRRFLESDTNPSRENVIPMLYGMDQDRIEEEWALPKLENFRQYISGGTREDRIINVLRLVWESVGFTKRGDHINSLSSPSSSYFKNMSAIQVIYPRPAWSLWWIDSYNEHANYCERLINNASDHGLPIKQSVADNDGTETDGKYYNIDLSSISFECAEKTGSTRIAELLIEHLDQTYTAVKSRVESRKQFSSGLFN